MALRGEPAKLSCFSWPSLWVFRLKWNPMGCELKLKNIFWKPNALSSVRDQAKLKPNLPPACSGLPELTKHMPLLSPIRKGLWHRLGVMDHCLPGSSKSPAHPRSWPCASALNSLAAFCPGGSRSSWHWESEALPEYSRRPGQAFSPQRGSRF